MLVAAVEVISVNQTAVEGTGSVEFPSGNTELVVNAAVVSSMGVNKAVLVSTCVVSGGVEVISDNKVVGTEVVIPTVEDIGVVDVRSVSTKQKHDPHEDCVCAMGMSLCKLRTQFLVNEVKLGEITFLAYSILIGQWREWRRVTASLKLFLKVLFTDGGTRQKYCLAPAPSHRHHGPGEPGSSALQAPPSYRCQVENKCHLKCKEHSMHAAAEISQQAFCYLGRRTSAYLYADTCILGAI